MEARHLPRGVKHHFRKTITVTCSDGSTYTGRLMMVSPTSILLVTPVGQITLWRREVDEDGVTTG